LAFYFYFYFLVYLYVYVDFDSYFWLHLIWRIYHDPAMNARLTPQSRANIEDMMWRWIRTRSRVSDAQGDTWVYHGSENHDAMQKGSFLLCAEALKDAPGYGPGMVLPDGQTLAQHATAWSGYLQRYFIARAGQGINAEIASPIYAKYSVGTYYNVMDFAESPVLRTLALNAAPDGRIIEYNLGTWPLTAVELVLTQHDPFPTGQSDAD
jgi:hypothetical protein